LGLSPEFFDIIYRCRDYRKKQAVVLAGNQVIQADATAADGHALTGEDT